MINDFPDGLYTFFERNWHLVIAGYYFIFLVVTIFRFPEERKDLLQDGKLRLKPLGHWLILAWTIPTLFVFVGLVGSLFLVVAGASGECHPSHGWACEDAPDFTFALILIFFKTGVALIQLILLTLVSVGGTLVVIGWVLYLAGKKCFPPISRVGKTLWERFPVGW